MEKELEKKNGHKCPVCGKWTFGYEDEGEFCGICGWQDDWYKEAHPDFAYASDEITLNQYRKMYEDGWRPERVKRSQNEDDA